MGGWVRASAPSGGGVPSSRVIHRNPWSQLQEGSLPPPSPQRAKGKSRPTWGDTRDLITKNQMFFFGSLKICQKCPKSRFVRFCELFFFQPGVTHRAKKKGSV